jgi:hypothetical protein
MNKRILKLFENAVIQDKFVFDCNMDEVRQNILRDFTDFCQEKLGIEDMPKVTLVDKKRENMSTGAYIPGANEVLVLVKGRAILDIARSLGHEYTHRKQDETGALKNIGPQGDRGKDDMSDVGVDFEDEANAKGGSLIKEFSRKYGKVPFEILFEL